MSSSRLAQQLKAQFMVVNEHFQCKRNAEIDVFLQKPNRIIRRKLRSSFVYKLPF